MGRGEVPLFWAFRSLYRMQVHESLLKDQFACGKASLHLAFLCCLDGFEELELAPEERLLNTLTCRPSLIAMTGDAAAVDLIGVSFLSVCGITILIEPGQNSSSSILLLFMGHAIVGKRS